MLGRSVRTSQPQSPGSSRIDWNNPITRGLIGAKVGDNPTNLANGAPPLRLQGTRSRKITRAGVEQYGTSAEVAYAGAVRTYFWHGVPNTANQRYGGAFGAGDTNGIYIEYNAVFRFVVQPSFTITSTGVALNGLPQSIAFTTTGDASHRGYVDGKFTGAISGTTTISQFIEFGLMYRQGNSLFPDLIDGNALVLAFNRALSDAEIKSLSDNPWQLFAPDTKSLWVPAESIAGGGSSITAASGSSITSTATGQAQAASTQTAATGTSTSSTLTGAAVVSATITAANGTSTTGTLAPGGSSAATITPAGGTSTASTMVGSSTSGANVADGPPIGGFVAIGQLGPASPVASGSTIAPANGSSIAETLTSSTSAAATITSAAGTSVTSTMVGASTSGTAATMTAAGGTSITSTMTSSVISSAVMLVNSSSSITSTMVGFPPTENNADTHDGYFHKLWGKLAKKPEYQLEILEERLEEIAEEIKQVKAIPVVSKSAITPQLPQFDAQAKLLQALIVESARIRRDIEDEEEAEMLLML